MTTIADIIKPTVPLPVGAKIYVQAVAPGMANNDDLWFDTTNQSWNQLTGGVWVAIGGGGGANLPAATRQGQLLIAGVAPAHAWAPGDMDLGRI